MLKVTSLDISDLLLLEPQVFGDERGFFLESYHKKTFEEALGRRVDFVQDNHSGSGKNVLRGLHYQVKSPQAKLVRCLAGRIYDVAVDLRPDSASFGRWLGVELSAENKKQLWLPEGLAHGFLALSERAEVFYKASDYYAPAQERTLQWNDPHLAIDWPLGGAEPILSDKDSRGLAWAEAIRNR
jgi:dTDP-4-dehydrorhamnose 3,5-epimerase